MDEHSEFNRNLRLLCGYSQSVSDACRKIGISRPQFSKYLSGKSFPTLRSLQRICDHYGLENWEILLPHSEFRKLIAQRPANPALRARPFKSALESEVWKRTQVNDNMRSFLGYYFSHYVVKSRKSSILRALVCLYEVDGAMFTKNIERYPEKGCAAKVKKYDGIAYCSSNRLYISERESFLGQSIWHSNYYATTTQREKIYSGLSMGSTGNSVQDIACYRAIIQYLGSQINVYEALKGCGTYSMTSPKIHKYVRDNIGNKIQKGENAFVAA